MDEVGAVRNIAARQDGVVTKAQALAAGIARHEVDSLCRAGRWQRLARGAYFLRPEVDGPIPRRAYIRAAVTSLGPDAVAVLGTAAELHEIAGLRSTDEIHVSLPGNAARASLDRDPRIRLHQMVIPSKRKTAVAGIATTDPLQTTADVILRVDRYAAVSVLDSALNRELITPEEFASIPALVRGRRGAVAARDYLTEANGLAQSPLETRVRLRCVDGHVRPDVLQHVVRDLDGYILGIGDMAWLRARVLAEADGAAPHTLPDAIFQDRRRQNRLANAGWLILRFTWQDTLSAGYIPWVVREALRTRLPR